TCSPSPASPFATRQNGSKHSRADGTCSPAPTPSASWPKRSGNAHPARRRPSSAIATPPSIWLPCSNQRFQREPEPRHRTPDGGHVYSRTMPAATVHPTADVSPDAQIGDGTRIWHEVQVREGARIGRECILGKGVYVDVDVV